MLDGVMRRVLDPALDAAGAALARRGIRADHVTLAGAALGGGAVLCIVLGRYGPALGFLILNRLADGLDGAVARASQPSARGAYLDIVLDFVFYGAFPLAFAVADPAANALAAAVLLASFYANGASFLAYSALAARRGMETRARGVKLLYFTTGLAEGTETIAVFIAMLVWPAAFPALAYGFAALCVITCAARVLQAWRVFGTDGPV